MRLAPRRPVLALLALAGACSGKTDPAFDAPQGGADAPQGGADAPAPDAPASADDAGPADGGFPDGAVNPAVLWLQSADGSEIHLRLGDSEPPPF